MLIIEDNVSLSEKNRWNLVTPPKNLVSDFKLVVFCEI